jgi:hypothetical protein
MKIGIRKTVKTPSHGETITAFTMQVLPDGMLGIGLQIEMPNKEKIEYLAAVNPVEILAMVWRVVAKK